MAHDSTGHEHFHTHSMFSLLDGYQTPAEAAARIKRNGGQYYCLTDHGAMGGIPQQIQACEKHGISPIFGCEFYYNPLDPGIRTAEERKQFMADLDEDQRKRVNKNYHLLAVAHSERGYSNLVRLSSWGYIQGWGGRPTRPRINKEMLLAHKEGITFTSCCYASEIGVTFDTLGEDAAMDKVEEYMAMFGRHFRLEIMMLDFAKQKPYDQFILKAHLKYHVPVILSQDAHYANPEDSEMQRLMLMIQTGKTVNEVRKLQSEGADLFELQDTQLWMKSEEELDLFYDQEYSAIIDKDIYKQAKQETVNLSKECRGVELDRSSKLPQIPDADEILWANAARGYLARRLPRTSYEYQRRLKEELELICRKGFSSYFLIQQRMTDEARRVAPEMMGWGDGSEAVGPGRGSAVGALTCYCLGITDVDPIKHDLLFSRFLSEARGGKTMKVRFANIDPIAQERTGYTGYSVNAGETWQDGL